MNNPHNNYILVNADTDSIMIAKPDGAPWTEVEEDMFLESLNEQFPEKINWEHDGIYEKVLVLKSKNYVLQENEKSKLKIKGSALRDSKREKKLLEFISAMVKSLLDDKTEDDIVALYNSYVKQCFGIKDMTPWTKKVTVTNSVLNPKRLNEQKVLDAIGERVVQEGDKIYVFYMPDESLRLLENFDGTYDEMVLVGKLHKTVEIFKNVLDMSKFPKYTLKRNKAALDNLLKSDILLEGATK